MTRRRVYYPYSPVRWVHTTRANARAVQHVIANPPSRGDASRDALARMLTWTLCGNSYGSTRRPRPGQDRRRPRVTIKPVDLPPCQECTDVLGKLALKGAQR